MSDTNPCWLLQFGADAAQRTDRFGASIDHLSLLAAGLIGEAGSVITELKKEKREREAYPVYRRRMLEEIGDFLWYYVRLVSVLDAPLLAELRANTTIAGGETAPLALFLRFGASVGDVLNALVGSGSMPPAELRSLLTRVWDLLVEVAHETRVPLPDAAANNTRKTESRWPTRRSYFGLFDDGFPEENNYPATLSSVSGTLTRRGKVVILRCNGINFGDRLTDNIEDPDGYRYHDIFHFSHAAHLGWSPVLRALLRCKRKSSSEKDEGQ